MQTKLCMGFAEDFSQDKLEKSTHIKLKLSPKFGCTWESTVAQQAPKTSCQLSKAFYSCCKSTAGIMPSGFRRSPVP